MTGSFSKITAPGLRLGWIYAPEDVMEKLVVAKQASDLHASSLCQRIVARYLETCDIDTHTEKITAAYAVRAAIMVEEMERLFPGDTAFTRPDGGMFIWVTFPEGISSMELFERTAQRNVAIPPGIPFYTGGGGDRTARFNFSCADPDEIREGIGIVAAVLDEMRK